MNPRNKELAEKTVRDLKARAKKKAEIIRGYRAEAHNKYNKYAYRKARY